MMFRNEGMQSAEMGDDMDDFEQVKTKVFEDAKKATAEMGLSEGAVVCREKGGRSYRIVQLAERNGRVSAQLEPVSGGDQEAVNVTELALVDEYQRMALEAGRDYKDVE